MKHEKERQSKREKGKARERKNLEEREATMKVAVEIS